MDRYDVWMYVGGNPFALVDPWGMGAVEGAAGTVDPEVNRTEEMLRRPMRAPRRQLPGHPSVRRLVELADFLDNRGLEEEADDVWRAIELVNSYIDGHLQRGRARDELRYGAYFELVGDREALEAAGAFDFGAEFVGEYRAWVVADHYLEAATFSNIATAEFANLVYDFAKALLGGRSVVAINGEIPASPADGVVVMAARAGVVDRFIYSAPQETGDQK